MKINASVSEAGHDGPGDLIGGSKAIAGLSWGGGSFPTQFFPPPFKGEAMKK